MNKKQISITVAIGVLAAGGGFFGGMKYGQSAKALASLSQEQRTQLLRGAMGSGMGFVQNGSTRARGTAAQGQMGNFIAGEVASKDNTSITLKTPDGSSKIVFYSGSTSIGKTASGTPEDLLEGQNVTVSGTTNSDGSLTASSIAIGGGMRITPPAAQ